MTKTLFFAASVALAAFVAGCSADTTEESGSTTTTDNGTLPAEQPSQATVVARKPVAKNNLDAARTLESIGDRGDGLRGVQTVQLPELPLQAPELTLKPEPINQ